MCVNSSHRAWPGRMLETGAMNPRSCFTTCVLVALLGCGDDTSSGAGGGGNPPQGGDAPTGGAAAGGGGADEGGGGATAGGGGQGGAGGAAPQNIEIDFAVRVGDQPAACGTTYTTLGVEGADVELMDMRFYVHDVRLVDGEDNEVPVELDQDGVWQVENVALLDFEDGTSACDGGTVDLNATIRGVVPAGDYQGIRFRVGVPFELNHADVATSPSPLNVTSLFWTWGLGHIFLSAVTSANLGKGSNEHFVHLGSVGCMGDPQLGEVVSCSNPNRPDFAFDDYEIGSSTIVLDLESLLSDSNLTSELGCHSFPDTPACVSPFDAIGIDYATGAPQPGQTLFTVE